MDHIGPVSPSRASKHQTRSKSMLAAQYSCTDCQLGLLVMGCQVQPGEGPSTYRVLSGSRQAEGLLAMVVSLARPPLRRSSQMPRVRRAGRQVDPAPGDIAVQPSSLAQDSFMRGCGAVSSPARLNPVITVQDQASPHSSSTSSRP